MTNNRIALLIPVFITAIILFLSATVRTDSGSPDSFDQAQQIVRESFNAHGQIRSIEQAGGFKVRLTGTFDLSTRLQGRSAFRNEPTPIEEIIAYDAASEWVSYDADYFNYYSSNQKYREIFDDKGRMSYIDKLNGNGGWLPIETVPDARSRYLRVLPEMVLAEVVNELPDGSRTMTYVGEREEGGAVIDVVSFNTLAGDTLNLTIDRESRLLQSLSYLIDMPLLGPTEMSWTWSNYTKGEAGTMNPGRLEVMLGDRTLKSVAMETTLGAFPEALKAPEGIEIGDPPEDLLRLADFVPYGQRPPEVETLAPRVYLLKSLRPGFALLFVEFDEFVVAVDAPTGWYEMNQIPPMNWSHGDAIDALGKKYLKAIRQTVPDKPVRYLVLTHHHSDHIGGLLPFVEASVKIIAGENAAHMARIAVDAGSETAGKLDLEIVNDEYTISDGEMSMRLIELPDGNPKADNYLMVYLPQQKLLYATGFIYPIPESVFPLKESIPLSQYFVKWLDESGLEVALNYNVHAMNKVEDWQLRVIRTLSTPSQE